MKYDERLMFKSAYEWELERLERYKRDFEWFQASFNEILNEYAKKFVAIKDQEIVDNDNDSTSLLKRLKRDQDIRQYLIEYVDKHKLPHVL
jgi:hypothetical protein